MRDPERIDGFCEELKKIWHMFPGWRFGQLMCNLLGEYQVNTGKDTFYPEDDELFKHFHEICGTEERK